MVSIFMASQCGIFFNIRKLLIYLFIFKYNKVIKALLTISIYIKKKFLTSKMILGNIFWTFEFILI